MTRSAFLVPHTHWDREWYRTFQQFRLDLVRVVDQILDTLDSDPAFTHFLLDGQAIAVSDYLTMRPERAGQLRRCLAEGRLSVGPWYCHPDLFLVSGESIVRNLMLGMRMARSYGLSLMVGYVPDQFGHTGQMPQILRGVGIDNAVLWRGVNARETSNESWWESPDGSRVLLVLLAQSYSNAQVLPLDPPALADRLRQLCELLHRGATGPAVLLMNGGDHLSIQPGLPDAVADANRILEPDWHVQLIGLEQAVLKLRDGGEPRGVLRGELRSPATAHLLPGVLSARIPLKRRNTLAQRLLEREAEPYATWAHLLGAPYPLGELWEAWRLLLQNQPHDSICGCSIDQVHREMGIRFDGVEQIGNELIARALDQIVAHVDTRLPEGAPTHTVPLIVINPGGIRTERVRLSLELPGVAAGYRLLDQAGRPVPHRWLGEAGEPSTVMPVPRESIPSPSVVLAQFDGNRMMGMGLQHVISRLEDDGLHVEVTVGANGIMSREELESEMSRTYSVLATTEPSPVTLHLHRNHRLELEFLARDMPALGYTTYWLQPADDATLAAADDEEAADTIQNQTASAHRIQNEYFVVEADTTLGSVTVTDRRDGTSYGSCNVFADSGDAGDTYTYAAPARNSTIERPVAPPDIEATTGELGATLRVSQELQVPVSLDESRGARSHELTVIRISSLISLTHGCPRIDVETTVDNAARDHRLRVLFRTPFAVDHVHADAAFEVVRRGLTEPAGDGTALEDPVPDAPQHGFVVVHEAERGLVVANVGLPEYEASTVGETTTLALTLLRSVGWLSRDDLPTRRGGAGPAVEVPEAQCAGRHTFSYSMIPFTGHWHGVVAEAHHCQLAPRALTATPSAGDLDRSGSFIELDAPGVLVSAIKGAEDGHGIVVRLYNVTGEDAHGSLKLIRPVARVERLSLDEHSLEILRHDDLATEVPVSLGPNKIETLRLAP